MLLGVIRQREITHYSNNIHSNCNGQIECRPTIVNNVMKASVFDHLLQNEIPIETAIKGIQKKIAATIITINVQRDDVGPALREEWQSYSSDVYQRVELQKSSQTHWKMVSLRNSLQNICPNSQKTLWTQAKEVLS